jgi:hypothetical protein
LQNLSSEIVETSNQVAEKGPGRSVTKDASKVASQYCFCDSETNSSHDLPSVRLRFFARNEFRDGVENDEAVECRSPIASMDFPPAFVPRGGSQTSSSVRLGR